MKFGNLDKAFTEKNFGAVIDLLNTGLGKLTFYDNFQGKTIVMDSIKKDAIIQVSRKGYIIVRQHGNGLLSGTGVIKGEMMELKNYGPDELKNVEIFSLE